MGELPPRALRTNGLKSVSGAVFQGVSFKLRSSATGINECHGLDLSTPPLFVPPTPSRLKYIAQQFHSESGCLHSSMGSLKPKVGMFVWNVPAVGMVPGGEGMPGRDQPFALEIAP